MSKNRRSSPERIAKTVYGRKFNELLQPLTRATIKDTRLNNHPIGLQHIFELVSGINEVHHVTVFTSDIIEARMLGGEETTILTQLDRLYGIDQFTDPKKPTSAYMVAPNPIEMGHTISFRENGTTRIYFGHRALLASPASPKASLRRSTGMEIWPTTTALVRLDSGDLRLYYRATIDSKNPRDCWIPYSENDKNLRLSHKRAKTIIGALSTEECIHRFETFCYSGWKTIKSITERCIFCQEKRERKPTDEEQKKFRNQHKQTVKLHDLYKRVLKQLDGLEGIKAIDKAERLEKKYRGQVHLVYCDDSAFSSSALLLIDHENDNSYMGTSVIYLPQCKGNREEFFLYPGHRQSLEIALEIVREKTEAHKKELGE